MMAVLQPKHVAYKSIKIFCRIIDDIVVFLGGNKYPFIITVQRNGLYYTKAFFSLKRYQSKQKLHTLLL